eukprot:jgi/Picsp_1/3557/NSC_06395-R1_vacuolar atp synthase subunit f
MATGTSSATGGLVAMIVDEDTATETTAANIEDAFRDFTSRDDVSVVLINQSIASVIRHVLDSYSKPVPAVLEIPSKDQPYDPTQDSILSRVKFMFGEG